MPHFTAPFARFWFRVALALVAVHASLLAQPATPAPIPAAPPPPAVAAAPGLKHQETLLGLFQPPSVPMVRSNYWTELQWRLTPASMPTDGAVTVVLGLEISQTSNGCRLAELVRQGGKLQMLVDGVPGPEYDLGDHGHYPVFSPDGRRLAYGTMRQGHAVVVVDEIAGPEFDASPLPTPQFSSDSQHVSYEAQKGGQLKTVLDGVVHDWQELSNPVFSPDGHHLAAQSNGPPRMVVEGRASPPYEGFVGAPLYSPDSQHLAYIALKQGQRLVVLDGVPGAPHQEVRSLVFSPDSQHLAYVASDGTGPERVIRDGVAQKEYAQVHPPRFSPDSQHLAYFAAPLTQPKGHGLIIGSLDPFSQLTMLVWDEQEGPPLLNNRLGPEVEINNRPALPTPLFSSTGRLAYATRGGQIGQAAFVMLDGTAGSHWETVVEDSLTFSPDGRHLAYAAMPDSETGYIVLDGHPIPGVSGALAGTQPVFSPDSHHLAYAAKINGHWTMVWDDAPGLPFDTVAEAVHGDEEGVVPPEGWAPAVFSADSRHLAYLAGKEGKQFVVVDQKPGPAFDAILAGPVRRSDGQMEYLATRTTPTGASLYRVVVSP